MSKKLFIRGTLLLTFTGLFSRLIGFFYRIFLSHTIGAHGLGIFQLVLPLQLLVPVCVRFRYPDCHFPAHSLRDHSRAFQARRGLFSDGNCVFCFVFPDIFLASLYLCRFLGMSYSERTSDSFSDSSAFFQYSSEHFS